MTSFNTDLSKPICRVCLQNNQGEEMSSIFDVDSEFDDLHIYEKIEQCADIKIIRHDKIPTLICGECYGFLNVSYKFRTVCRNSNEYLKKIVVSGKSTPLLPEESALNDNPLLIEENANKKRGEGTQYQTRQTQKASPNPPIMENIETKQDFIKNENDSNSPINFEDFNDLHDLDDDEVWLDQDYQDDDDCDVSIGSLQLDVKDEDDDFDEPKKSLKSNKKSTAKKKIAVKKTSKTLDISSDGAAIIREKKPHGKREKNYNQPQVCEICGNIYRRRYTLEMHMRRHGDKKEFECEICSDAFHSNFELNRHMRKHTGSKPYTCSYCSRSFSDHSTLTKHERIHRNERPFKCETCGKSFTYSTVLKYHMYIHTGEKPYACEICGKCFIRKHHLRAHLETLQHQNDSRAKIQLANITENNMGP
ncbi:zinc finger protein 3 [Lucilia sericata]|uniref:zinc finger protein 3 n=1 Tax=Lucilia sericata TaxID=13632 RepID=UPI0018A88060|nr:zinc finger protein 3 [Lucilia sericata]